MTSSRSNGRGRGISNVPAWMSQSTNTTNTTNNNDISHPNDPSSLPNRDIRENYNGRPRSRSRDRSRDRDRDRSPRDRSHPRGSTTSRREFRDPHPYRGGGGGTDRRPSGWDPRDDSRRPYRSSPPPSNRPYHNERRPYRSSQSHRPIGNRSGIFFDSLSEEREWVEERRRKRRERRSLFDIEPTAEQMAMEELQKATLAASGAHPASFVRLDTSDVQGQSARDSRIGVGRRGDMGGGMRTGSSSQPQQTRHARRLYIGHLPPDLDEEEVHRFFRSAIRTCLGEDEGGDEGDDDPILSVYINKERRFAFVEFKTMDICTACLALDGVNVCNKGKVKIKRPNDYNPSLAPPPSDTPDSVIKRFDISKLGIVSGTVPDSPNKIFIGGLPYHLNESQVMELLGAFGKVKAFHLVKSDPTAVTSKGYCFVEYSDGESVRDVAVMGLNGMDMGGGKILSARIAAVRGDPDHPPSTFNHTTNTIGGIPTEGGASTGMSVPGLGNVAPIIPSSGVGGGVPPPMRYVDGVDVEALLDVAMGIAPLSVAAVVTDDAAAVAAAAGMYYGPGGTTVRASGGGGETAVGSVQEKPVMDIANAALEAAFGTGGGGGGGNDPSSSSSTAAAAVGSGATPTNGTSKTRILVLLNMVTDDDLETDEDYHGLVDEVKEECCKFGNLLGMKVPRAQDGFAPSAVKKIFLEYATVQDSSNAENELAGRQFGPATVGVEYLKEDDYANGNLS